MTTKVVKSCLFLFVSVFVLSFNAQDFDNYQPLQSSGNLPPDLTLRTSVKYAKDLTTEIDSDDKRKVKKSKSTFLLKSNYTIDELLMSGRVLFGDPVSEYVNKVAAKVLETEPELQDKLRFYCIKSNVTNAFTTNQGMIFITLGLLSQLENEAQLAYVLAHEISHYKKKHVINSYLESDKIYAKKGRYKYNNYDNNIIKLSNYSKTLELEADSLGFNLFEKAGYNKKAANSVLDVLQFSHLPYDEIEFDISFLESENFFIPAEHILDTIVPIDFTEDYDDSKSTHPNIDKRRSKSKKLIAKSKSKNKALYLVSKEDFLSVRTVCRFEAIKTNLKNREYVKAIFNSMILQKDYPTSTYLNKSIGKALYGIYKYKSIERYYSITSDYDNHQGNISSAYFLFESIGAKQIGVIAIRYLWKTYLQTKDEFIKRLLDDAIGEIIQIEELTFESFTTSADLEIAKEKLRLDSIKNATALNDSIVQDSLVVEDEPIEGLSKYERLRKIKEEQEEKELLELVVDEKTTSETFYLLAMVDLPKANKLKRLFDKIESEINEEKRLTEKKESDYDALSYRKKKKIVKKNKKNKLKIGASRIVYVDPEYLVIDDRKGVKLVNSEDKKIAFCNSIEEIAGYTSLEAQVLSPKLFDSRDVISYNDLAAFNDWVGEKMDHKSQEKRNAEFHIIPSEAEFITSISEKYYTDLIAYTGVITYKEKRLRPGTVLLLTLLFYPTLPYGIYYATTAKYYIYYYTFVYNTRTNEMLIEDLQVVETKGEKGIINSFTYDKMVQMQSQPKK